MTDLPTLEDLQRWVSWYRKLGLNVISLPLSSKGREGTISWKEYQNRKASDEEIAQWFSRLCNVAVVNGKISGNHVAIDVDSKKVYYKLFGESPETFTVETYKGFHGHYTTDILPPSKRLHDYGIEILSHGTIAIMPPSVHEEGIVYRPYKGSKTPENNMPIKHVEGDFMEWVYSVIRQRLDKNFEPKREIIDIDRLMQGVREGERNNAAIRIATWLRRAGLYHDSCLTKILEWNQLNTPPCEGSDYDALLKTVEMAYKVETPYAYRFTRQPQQITVFKPEIRAKAVEILEQKTYWIT